MSASHGNGPILGNHNQCYYCHLYQDGTTADYDVTSAANHRDGNIEIGATADDGSDVNIGFKDNGSTVGCVNCHVSNDGVGAGTHEFNEESSTARWTQRDLITSGPVFDCNSCHASNGADHTGGNESSSVHDTHANSTLTSCSDCHATPGAGGHNGGTVEFGGSELTAPASYVQGSFLGTCTNACHDTTAVTWAAGSLTCDDCHSGTYIGTALAAGHVDHNLTIPPVANTECANCHGAGSYTTSLGASHGNGEVTFTDVTYSAFVAATVPLANSGTCTTTNCHNTGAQSNAWDSGALACDSCHGDFSGGLSNSHTAHFSAAYITDCSECHTTPGAGDTTHITNKTTLIDGANALSSEAAVLAAARGAVGRATPQSCDTSECHNPSAGASNISNDWGTANAGCAMCHADASGDPASGDHTAHLADAFGRDIVCVDCHNTLPVDPAHMDGSKSVEVRDVSGTFSAVATPTAAGACGTNECHNDGDTGAPNEGSYQWGVTDYTNCTECHLNDTGMVTVGHDAHLNNGYASAPCTECHADPSTTTHLNQLVNFNAGNVTYTGGAAVALGAAASTETCTTTSCHNTGVASAAWNSGGLTCSSCHSATNPETGAHTTHIETAGKACGDCHTVPTDTTHITNKTTLADGANAIAGEGEVTITDMTWSSQTCSYVGSSGVLGCHATGSPTGWTIPGAQGCTDCHTDTSTSEVNPTSGLHAASRIAGNAHTDGMDDGNAGTATCQTCHTATPSTGHQNSSLVGAEANFAADVNKSGSTCAPGTGLSSCHDDGGTWSRL
jgi:predicted CxxxxCH...CXXCH cytochrome family protein